MGYAACVPFGREPDDKVGVWLHAASAERLPDDLLTRIEVLLGVSGADTLRYADARAGQRRAIAMARTADDTMVTAFVLAGDVRAAGWIGELLVERLPADLYGRALLSGSPAAPTPVPARGAQVCSCFDITEPQIEAVLARCDGAPDEQLAALQGELKCGTNCGSCLPKLRSMVKTTHGGGVSGCCCTGRRRSRAIPDLLTIKAVRAIRRATVLLVDDLVGDGVLRYARKSARIVHVGKRGGCASTPQEFIERLMIAEAQRGERVVRLKGGDPFVFGRGGEEAEHLRAAGVEVEVINGITSGLAAATALGVPWTHRQHARGVMLVTGHAKEGGAAPHWPTLGAAAAQGLTLVIYMGVSQLESIVAGLMSSLPPNTPAALVQGATTAGERRVASTLDRLVADARAHDIGSPAVLIIGNVLQGMAATQLAKPNAAIRCALP